MGIRGCMPARGAFMEQNGVKNWKQQLIIRMNTKKCGFSVITRTFQCAKIHHSFKKEEKHRQSNFHDNTKCSLGVRCDRKKTCVHVASNRRSALVSDLKQSSPQLSC